VTARRRFSAAVAQHRPKFIHDPVRFSQTKKNARGCHDSDTQSGMNAPANALRLDG